MSDIFIRKIGHAGRITLNRPDALNAVTYDMCLAIHAALRNFAKDNAVALVVIDAAGDRAFCAGGDIAEMYATGTSGDFSYGRRFWRDEYRMNAALATYPKPVVSFLQGFTMGGGVGVGCHGSHRIVGESSRIAMPEAGIGLVPDVGGSLLLARAPGCLGAYLATTTHRMTAADAIACGFADVFVPEADWPELIGSIEATGDWTLIDKAANDPGRAPLLDRQDEIDTLFRGSTLADIFASADEKTATAIARVSPLSAAVALEMLHRLKGTHDIHDALAVEYRVTWRAMEHGDFLEGIRAAIIDKDRTPNWRHTNAAAVTELDIARMLAPLGENELTFPEEI